MEYVNCKKDIIWVDYSKFIGIILVISGHTMSLFGQNSDVNFINRYIAMFHMPLFFVIAGYLYKDKTKKENNIKIVKGLLIPYFIYQFTYFPFIAIKQIIFKNTDVLTIIQKGLFGIFFGPNVPEPDFFFNICGPCWFILVMIQLRVLFNNIKLSDKNLILLTVCSIILLKVLSLYQIDLYFCLDNFLMAIPYFVLGYFVKIKYPDFIESFSMYKKYLILFCAFFVFVIMKYNGLVRIADLITSLKPQTSLILTYIGGVAGTLMVCLFSTYIKVIPDFIKTISRNTLFIIFFHYLIIFIESIFKIKIATDCSITIVVISLTIVSLILNYVTIKILEKYAPFVLGKYTDK